MISRTSALRLLSGTLVATLPLATGAAGFHVSAAEAVAPVACAELAHLSLADAAVTSATEVVAPFTAPSNSGQQAGVTIAVPFAFCRVAVHLTPSSDSDIHAEVWLPVSARWNGKFLGVGNGGLTGSIWFTSMQRPLQRGYAVAGSDLGHTAPNIDWANGHPEKLTDYAHRADHVTAVAAKAIIAAYYSQRPRFSYFHGCSNGGHQALMEAQRYPEDYNGVIAGAPWNGWTHQVVAFAWRAQQLEKIDKAKLPMITKAAVAQCRGRDGGADGDSYLNDPRTCGFDPKTIQCTGETGPSCLTAGEVDALRQLYDGPSDSAGRRLFPGPERASEANWSPNIGSFTNNLYRSLLGKSAEWDVRSYDFGRDVEAMNATLAPLINSDRTDMSAFRARGGKVLMWHGWSDPLLESRHSIDYYNRVIAAKASSKDGATLTGLQAALADTQAYFRLFMAPGVNHCGGGPGPGSTFAYTLANAESPVIDASHDALAALERWVESGTAPETFVTSHVTDGAVDRTRPLCAYPKVARYDGHGDVNAPQSFACVDDWAAFQRDHAAAVQ